MSIYVKGEEFYKPTACAPCKLRNWCQLWKQVVLPAHLTHPECPIVEVKDVEERDPWWMREDWLDSSIKHFKD